jgi:hypothetical protein
VSSTSCRFNCAGNPLEARQLYAEGPATTARFNGPQSMAVQSDTTALIVTDFANNRIRRADSVSGNTSVVAGSGAIDVFDGVGTSASFKWPLGITFVLGSSSLTLVTDYGNHCLRRVDVTTGNVTSLSPCGTPGIQDGPLSGALFNMPHALTRPEWSCQAYLTDLGNHRFRRIDLKTGWVATVVGTGHHAPCCRVSTLGVSQPSSHSVQWRNRRGTWNVVRNPLRHVQSPHPPAKSGRWQHDATSRGRHQGLRRGRPRQSLPACHVAGESVRVAAQPV